MKSVAHKLVPFGVSIFSEMTALANQHQAVNLSQGFPDFDGPDWLKDVAAEAIHKGPNQYAPSHGLPALRQAIAAKTERFYGLRYDPDTEVTVLSGATEGIFSTFSGLLDAGDEIILFEPFYDSYAPSAAMSGATVRYVPLRWPAMTFDETELAAAFNERTRFIMVNTPNNPSGKVFSRAELEVIASLAKKHDTLVLTDEVYEHMVFDGKAHESAARFPDLAARSFIVSSFGKTYHVTGWKIGYVAAPAPLTAEFRKVHQFNVFTVNTPVQHGLAAYMADPKPYLELPAFYQRKRDLFREGLAKTRLRVLPSEGTYFQCADISAVSDLSEADFCKWLTSEIGVAAIPISAFYGSGFDQRVIRFCFAKRDDTLDSALSRLAKL